MNFNRYGKSYQMVLQNGKDLKEALTLDEALWMALSAPINYFNSDPKFMELMDTDHNGRVTSCEVRNGMRWLLDMMPDHEAITLAFDGKLPLDKIDNVSDEGKALIASANYIHKELPADDKEHITLQHVRDFITHVISLPLNGDGVLTPKAASSQQMTDLIADVIAANGGEIDVDGSKGIGQASMDAFFADVPVYLEWLQRGKIPEGQTTTEIMAMGIDTPALSILLKQHADKIDQFFQLSKLLDFDGRIDPKKLSTEAKLAGFDPAATADVNSYQDALPIATPVADCLLTLDEEKANPAYRAWFKEAVEKIIRPILGAEKASISQQDWNIVKNTFAAYDAYLASKAGVSVAALSEEKLIAYTKCDELKAAVVDLMGKDKAVAEIITGAKKLEQLILYRTYMLPLVNNFISFTDLYDPKKHAMFEIGKMVIDGRWFSVAFKIDSVGAHQAASKGSLIFLFYAEIVLAPGKVMNVVVPVTSGSKGNLVVGKRGLFYDLNGKDYDARITAIVENPICIREAVLAPIIRLWSIIEGKLTAWSGDAEKKLQGNFTNAITPTDKPAPKPAEQKEGKMNANAFMGIGIAVAAIGSSLAFISKTLSSMTGFQIWMMVIIAILAVMLPFSIIAIIKLNKQDISSVLEGCGWSINLKVGLNTALRRQFTYFGKYPKDAKGTPKDSFIGCLLTILLIIVLCFGGCKYYKYRQNQKAEREAAQKALVEKAEKEAEKAAAEQAEKEAAQKAAAEAEAKAAEAQEAPAPAPAQ